MPYLSTKFSWHNDLATLGTRLHNETEDTITSTTHSQTSDKLITKWLSLSNGAKSTGCYLLGVQINWVLWEIESFLYNWSQLTDPPALLTEDILGAGSHNDNFGLGWGNTDLNTGVTIFGQFTSQKLVKFGLEDTIGDKLENKFREIILLIAWGSRSICSLILLFFRLLLV